MCIMDDIKEGDIVIPSENNMERFDLPKPRYKITQIGCGRVYAENLLTYEQVTLHEDVRGDYGDFYYYYEKKSRKK